MLSINFKVANFIFFIFEVLMNRILLSLNKSYPLEERKLVQIKLAFIFGLVVFMLMYFVKPFGFNGSQQQLLLNSLFAGASTAFAICFDFLVLFPLFPQFFKEEKWTVGREMIFTLIIITTIATFNVLAAKIMYGEALSLLGWLRMIFYTGIIGLAPATISILLNQTRLLKKYRKEAGDLNEQLPVHITEKIIVENVQIEKPNIQAGETIKNGEKVFLTIEAENEKENLSILPADFIAATSADNYVKVYYLRNEKLVTAILRTTLKKVSENTAAFPSFYRCHRTALVNLGAVQNVVGTAQGYRLQLSFLHEEIPVSRNLNKEVKERLNSLTLMPSPSKRED